MIDESRGLSCGGVSVIQIFLRTKSVSSNSVEYWGDLDFAGSFSLYQQTEDTVKTEEDLEGKWSAIKMRPPGQKRLLRRSLLQRTLRDQRNLQ
ncbi:hypothetical protein Q3G72_031581 [Acer saccharum]|nr:hypothetical protein Q3G72_031581 [Acer saccharum]